MELPGVKVDNKLNFNEHLDGIIKRASRKVSSLSTVFPLMDLTKICVDVYGCAIVEPLITEMFKVCRNISPPIVGELFQLRNNDYNLRQFSQFNSPNVRSVF